MEMLRITEWNRLPEDEKKIERNRVTGCDEYYLWDADANDWMEIDVDFESIARPRR